MSILLDPIEKLSTFYNMQSVSSNAVAQTLLGYATKSEVNSRAKYGYYDANTDRGVEATITKTKQI